ncbi:MAG: NADPH-dependent F420 reductase [Gemmatimonadetes bacterium]|nr:MAG: NADPH-dependent F420 reductase [Gemmatimonadota bacterium]
MSTSTTYTIGIIGAGNMGAAFAKRLAAAGHRVAITATDASQAEQAARAAGAGARAVPAAEVARGADLLILAVPYGAAVDALRAAGDLAGTTVIDISNPLKPDMSGLQVGHTTSAAEEIQRAVPTARVVKAFNTIFAPLLAGDARAQVFFAGDDAEAKERVRAVIDSAGFEAVDAGPLANARHLEPAGMLNIYFAYVAGRGPVAAPAWVAVA